MLQRAAVNGVDLEYELCGAGEPVVLIHWGVGAKWVEPLLEQQALTSRYQLLHYHRAGFAGSGPLEGPHTMAAHAARCHQLMGELGITRGPHRRPLFQRPGSTPARAGRPRARAHAHPHGGRAARPAYRYPAEFLAAFTGIGRAGASGAHEKARCHPGGQINRLV